MRREMVSVFSSRRLIDDSEDRVPGYTTGQRVRHNVFGDGTITAVDEAREACVVLFDGMGHAPGRSLFT